MLARQLLSGACRQVSPETEKIDKCCNNTVCVTMNERHKAPFHLSQKRRFSILLLHGNEVL